MLIPLQADVEHSQDFAEERRSVSAPCSTFNPFGLDLFVLAGAEGTHNFWKKLTAKENSMPLKLQSAICALRVSMSEDSSPVKPRLGQTYKPRYVCVRWG